MLEIVDYDPKRLMLTNTRIIVDDLMMNEQLDKEYQWKNHRYQIHGNEFLLNDMIEFHLNLK